MPLLETDRHIEDVIPYPRSFLHAKSREERKFEYVKAFEEKPFDLTTTMIRLFVSSLYVGMERKFINGAQKKDSHVLDGGWIMIVMEFLGNTWKEFTNEADTQETDSQEADKQQQKLRDSIASFIENLGGKKMVFAKGI